MADDPMGYRTALINAFRARGIRPEGVLSYSEEALSWSPYEGQSLAKANPNFKHLWADLNRLEDTPSRRNQKTLYKRLWGKAGAFCHTLGLSLDYPVQAKSLHPLHRVRPDGTPHRQIVAELVQKRPQVEVEPGNPDSDKFTFRGGTTLLINRLGEVRYSILKPIDGPAGEARLERQRSFLRRSADSFALAPYVAFDAGRDLSFCGIHRGY